MAVNDAPVRHAPAGLRSEGRHSRIEGRVVSSDRARHEIRIATKRGEITVKSGAPIPPDTEVIVELYTREGAELARIYLLRQQAELAGEPLPGQPLPPPPLKPGDVVTALLMPAEAAEPPQQQEMSLRRVAQIFETLQLAGIQKLPQPLPVPPVTAAQLAAAPDLYQALQNLPPQVRQDIISYMMRPDVAAKLQALLPGGTEAEMAQNIGAQVAAKTAPHAGIPAGGALQSLAPLLETLQGAHISAGGIAPRLTGHPMTAAGAVLAGILPQNMLSLRVLSVTAPEIPPPPPPPGTQQGKVEFITSAGFPAISAAEGHFILRTAAGVEIGSTVTFESTPMTAQQIMAAFPATPAGAVETQAFHPLRSVTWPALQEALAAVSGAQNAALQNTIPAPAPRLAPAALFFLSALRLGTVESWLGAPLLQNLRDTGKQNIAERLAGDFGRIAAQAKETVGGEWRAISMPMLHDGELSQVQFYIRRHDEEAEGKEKTGGRPQPVRFILNLHLSRMGDMQLDGLLRRRQFDLILRSAEALPPSIRRDLMQSFASGLAQAQMQGGLSFQTRAEKWVTVDLPHEGTEA